MQSEGENHRPEHQDGPGTEVLVYAAPFFQRFQEFRRKELFTDLYIYCGSECYFVHSSVLAAACPPICLLLEASQKHSKEDSYYSRETRKPPHDVIDEELKINSKCSKAQTGFDSARKTNPCLTKQFGKVKVLSYNGDHGIHTKEHFVLTVPFKDTMGSNIILSLSNHVTGVWNLLIQGIEPQVMNYIIQFVYWEKFVAAKECIHNFISTAKSLQLLGCESMCEGLQFATPGERRYFGVHDENKTINSSSSKIGASYGGCASNKAGSSFQASACNLMNYVRDMREVKGINPVQKLGNEAKVERSNFQKCEAAQGLNENASRQEGDIKARNCMVLRKEEATKVKNFTFQRLRDREIKGKSISLWRPDEIKSRTDISNQEREIEAKNDTILRQERETKTRHDCVPRQELEIKTKNFIVSKQQGGIEAMHGSFIRQEGETKARNCFIPKQENTSPRIERVNARNYFIPKHKMTKAILQSLNHGVLDNMNIPKTSRDIFNEQKCLICPREIYSRGSSSHGIQNRDLAVEVGSATGSRKMCNRENSFIHDNTLQEGIAHDVTFSVSQIIDSKRKNTHQKLNLILGKGKFNVNIEEARSRSCNKDKAESLIHANQKILEKTGLHDTDGCNGTERNDNNTLRLNDTVINTEKYVSDLGIIHTLKKLHDVIEGQFLIIPLRSPVKNVKALGKKKVSRYFPSFKPNRQVRNPRVHHEHSYCKLKTAAAVKISHRKVLDSSNFLRISCKDSGIGICRVDFGYDARTPNVRLHSPKNKIHLTHDAQDQILEYEENLEANERGLLGTQSHMLANTSVQRTYEIVQSRSEGQGKEKLIVEEENPKRDIRYQKRQDHPNFYLPLSGEKNSEPKKYIVSHKRIIDHLMNCEQNNLCDNQGPTFVDDYRHFFESPNQQVVQCNDLCDQKLEEQTNYVAKLIKQAKSHPFGETDVQVKVRKDKVLTDAEKELQSEVNNHLEDQDKDHKVESWNTMIQDKDDIIKVKEDRCKFDDKENNKVKLRHSPSVDRERESSFESGNEILKGIPKKILQIEENIDQLDYVEGGAVTEVKLEQWQDNMGKVVHGDVLNYRLDDGKRSVQMVILDDKYEDGKESMLVKKYDGNCPLFENPDIEKMLIEGFFMKDPLLEYSGLRNQPYDDDGSKHLPVEECTTEFLLIENKCREDLLVDKDGLEDIPVENVMKDTERGKNHMKDNTLGGEFRKSVECELDCDVRDINVQVEVAQNDFKEGSLTDACNKMINFDFSREEMEIEVEVNDQNEPKVEGMEYEKNEVGEINKSEVNESRVEEDGKSEPQVKRNVHVDDQDVMNTELNEHVGADKEDEMKTEEVEVEDCSHIELDSQVKIRNCNFEGISERKKLEFQEAIFSLNEFSESGVQDVERSDLLGDRGKKSKPDFMTSELERIGKGDREDKEIEKLDEASEYSTDFKLNNMLEENCHNSSEVATRNRQIETGDNKVGPQESLFNLNEDEESHREFSVSLDFKNSFDYMGSKIMDKEKYALKKVFDLTQERDGTSLEYGDSNSCFVKAKSLQKNALLRKYNSQDLVSNSKNYCKNSEIQEYEPQSQIQLPVDTVAGMENVDVSRINYESAKESSSSLLKESKRIEELQPLSTRIPKLKKKHNGMFLKTSRKKRKIQKRRQRLLKNPLHLEQRPEGVCDNKAVEGYQQNQHSTQFTMPPNTVSPLHCTKLSGECLQISSSSSSCCNESCAREVFEEDSSIDDELLSHVTWGKFEDEVEYVVVGDAVSSGYMKATHSYLKTSKRYVTEAGIEPVVKSEEFLAPPDSPGSVMDFIDEHSSAPLDDNIENIHLPPLGRIKKESLEFCIENKRLGNQSNRLQVHAGRPGDKFQERYSSDSRSLHYCKENNPEKSPDSKLSSVTSRIQQSDKLTSDSPNMCIATYNGKDGKELERRKDFQSQERNDIDKSWNIITNYDNIDTVSSQNSAKAEFIVEVGEVSVKIREYSFVDYQKSRLDQETPLDVMPSNNINNNLQRKEREQMCDMVEQRPFTEEGALQCLGCPDMFATLEALTSHFRERHMKNKFFMFCPVENCSAKISYNKMDIHIKNHVVLQNFKCPDCSFSTATPSSLGRHLNVHKQKDSFLNEDPEHHIGTPYHVRRMLGEELLDSSHLKTRSCESQQFREEISNTEIAFAEASSNGIDSSLIGKGDLLLSNASLVHHKQYENKMSKKKIKTGRVVSRRIHLLGGKKHPIHCCSLVFSTVEALRKHFRWYHLRGQECVPCPDPACPVKLWGSNMDSHLRCHTIQGEYKCHQCTYSGRNALALRIHTRAHRKKSKAVQEEDRPAVQRQTETNTDTTLGKGSSIPQLEDIHIEKTRKSVTHPTKSIEKVAFLSSTQREEKEMLSCLGSNVEKKKNLSAFQKWKLSQANMLLSYDSKNKDIYEFEERNDDVSTKILTKRRRKKLGGKNKRLKKCLLDRGTLVKNPYRSTKNIRKLASCKPIKIKCNEIQKVDKTSLSQISVAENRYEISSLAEVVGTAQNTQNLSSESSNKDLKRLIEEAGGYNTSKSQSDMKVQVNSTQSSNYDCPLCVDYYDTADRLVYHYVCSHPYHSPYTCKFEGCPVLLKKRDSWKHIIGHLYRKSYRCHLCSYSHQNLHLLKHHLSCHSEVIQEMQLKDEVPLQIQGPSGYTEVVMTAESFKKRLKRKLSMTTDNSISTKCKKGDIYPSTESTPKLEGQSMYHLAFETCVPQHDACFKED